MYQAVRGLSTIAELLVLFLVKVMAHVPEVPLRPMTSLIFRYSCLLSTSLAASRNTPFSDVIITLSSWRPPLQSAVSDHAHRHFLRKFVVWNPIYDRITGVYSGTL